MATCCFPWWRARAWPMPVIILLRFLIPSQSTPKSVVAVTPQPQQQVSAPLQQNNNEMLGSLNSLRTHDSHTESQIQALKTQISDMQNSIDQAQSANQQLQKSVEALTAQTNMLAERLSRVLTKQAVQEDKVVYHLRAVIPDRAWITSNTGKMMNVTVGDYIGQYGTVRSIDADDGVVLTSSGRKIQYGANDF